MIILPNVISSTSGDSTDVPITIQNSPKAICTNVSKPLKKISFDHYDSLTGTFNPAFDHYSTDTGEIWTSEYDYSDALRIKYRLQTFAREALSEKKGKEHRTVFCLRRLIELATDVTVTKSIEHQRCRYSGVMVCGSVWCCPVCNSRISEVRAEEIKTVVNEHVASGGRVAFLTLTVPHGLGDDLSLMLKSFWMAFTRTWISEAAKRLKKEIVIEGYIRVLETTFSYQNGFHPHYHILLLYRSDRPELEIFDHIKNTLFPPWRNRCVKMGLGSPSYKHGLHVKGGESVAEYLAKFGREQKWGLHRELTKLNSKRSNKDETYTPFDFLRCYLETGDKDMLRLFLEYSEAFHGKKFISWSRGLKERYGIDDSIQKDKEIAESTDELAVVIGRISSEDWKKILHHEERVTVLILAATSWEVTKKFIDSLPAV